MIYITGDIHGTHSIDKFYSEAFQDLNLTNSDYMIVCGDIGVVWSLGARDIGIQDFYKNNNFITLFVDGNHENHDGLNNYPVEMWNGGKVHKINDKLIHLMRGQVYLIDGKKFFTMGGATSVDKHMRTEFVSWWSNEMPSSKEYEEALINLNSNDWQVNYIITHCISDRILKEIASWYEQDSLTNFLDSLEDKLQFNHWYCGHYHIDKEFYNRYTVLYDNIIKIIE